MDEQTRDAIQEWIRRFNGGEYFEAHEVVETSWLRARPPEKEFLKGLIHAAVALCHYQKGNGHGARVKFGSAARYLDPFRPSYGGIPVEDLLARMHRFFAPLLALPAGSRPPEPTEPWPTVSKNGEGMGK